MRSVQAALNPIQVPDVAPDFGSGTWSEYLAQDRGKEMGRLPSDRDFVAMRAGYRATGGIALGEDLARLLEDVQHGGFVGLNRTGFRGGLLA